MGIFSYGGLETMVPYTWVYSIWYKPHECPTLKLDEDGAIYSQYSGFDVDVIFSSHCDEVFFLWI